MGIPPLGIHQVRELGKDLDAIHDLLTHAFPLTQVFNMMGYPAMSVPLYWTADGLPMGSQFGASWGREDMLFRLAAQLEQAAPWFNKRPAIATAAGRAAMQ